MGRRRITGLKTRAGRKCSISRGGLDCTALVCRRSPRRESQCYEWGHSREAGPRVTATKSSEFGEGEL